MDDTHLVLSYSFLGWNISCYCSQCIQRLYQKLKIKQIKVSQVFVGFVDNFIQLLQKGLNRLFHVRFQLLRLKLETQMVLQFDKFGPDQQQLISFGHPYCCHHILHHQDIHTAFQFDDLVLQGGRFGGLLFDALLQVLSLSPLGHLGHPVILHFFFNDELGGRWLVILVHVDQYFVGVLGGIFGGDFETPPEFVRGDQLHLRDQFVQVLFHLNDRIIITDKNQYAFRTAAVIFMIIPDQKNGLSPPIAFGADPQIQMLWEKKTLDNACPQPTLPEHSIQWLIWASSHFPS